MSQMKCPFCGTMQPVRHGVSCANKSCEAFLSARTLKTKQDPLGRFVTTFALEKKPGRPLMSKLNKKTKILVTLFITLIIIGLYLYVIFMLPNAEKIARCESSAIAWNNVFSSVADQYEFSAPYKDGGEIKLVMDVSFLTSANVELRGYGTASLSDSFDTSVQVSYYFDSTKVTSGETQSITLSIPINDFGVQKPKEIYVRLPILLDGEDAFILLTYDMVW